MHATTTTLNFCHMDVISPFPFVCISDYVSSVLTQLVCTPTRVRLYLAQRISAMIMAPLVLAHLGLMVYAIRGGLTAGEILGRTHGSVFWASFYGIFVAAASLHGAIGVRVIVHETLGLRGPGLGVVTWGVFGLLFWFGARAVTAVTMI